MAETFSVNTRETVDLFFQSGGVEFAPFGRQLLATLGATRIEQRFSDNYFGGTYLRGWIESVEVTYQLTDEAGMEEYDLMLALDSSEDSFDILTFADKLAGAIAVHGMRTARRLYVGPRETPLVLFEPLN